MNKSHQIAALTLPPSLFCSHHPPQMTASLFFPPKNWLSSLGKHQKVPVGLPAGEEARRPANSQMSCLCNKRSLCLGITSRDLTLRPHCSFCMPVWLNWELFFAQGGWKHQVVDPSDKGFYRSFVRNRHPHYIAYTPVDTCQEQRRQPNGYTQKKKKSMNPISHSFMAKDYCWWLNTAYPLVKSEKKNFLRCLYFVCTYEIVNK